MSGRGDRRTEQSQLGMELALPTRVCCGALKQPSAKPRDADVSLAPGHPPHLGPLASWATGAGGCGLWSLEGFPVESGQCLTRLSRCDLKSECAWCSPRRAGTRFSRADLCRQPPPAKAPGSGGGGRAEAPLRSATRRVEKEAGDQQGTDKQGLGGQALERSRSRGSGGRHGAGLDTAVLGGPSEEVTFEKSPKGKARASLVSRWEEKAKTEGPG